MSTSEERRNNNSNEYGVSVELFWGKCGDSIRYLMYLTCKII